MTLGIKGEIGRLVRQTNLARQMVAQQIAEPAGAGPTRPDRAIVTDCANGAIRQGFERHGRGRRTHRVDHFRDNLGAHVVKPRSSLRELLRWRRNLQRLR